MIGVNINGWLGFCCVHIYFNEKTNKLKLVTETAKNTMEPFMACRICLNTDVILYEMSRYRLKSTYEAICGNNASQLSMTPHHLCAYCATLLNKFALFKEKCEHAKFIMEILVAEHTQLTTQHIRKINKLQSNIALPYTTQIIHNLDSTTEIKKEEYEETELNGSMFTEFTDYDNKEFLDVDIMDFKNDSDNEPLSTRVRERKAKKKTKKDKDIGLKSEIEPLPCESNVESVENCENSDFELILLTKDQQLEEVLARKNSSNYQNSLYKCEYCYKGFMTEVTFQNHMVRHDLSAGPLVCEVCGSRWAQERALRAHALTHARRYACRLCGHAATSHHKAKEHIQWHKGYLFVCKLCGATFSKSTTHLTHMRLRHATDAAACDACGDRFLGENGLNMHKKKAHRHNIESSIQLLDCICGSKFRNEDALKRHRDIAADDICDTRLRPCEHCGESFTNEETYKEHSEMHIKVDALRTCGECARTFANERALGLHRARAHAAGARGAGAGAGAGARARPPAPRAVCEVCGHTCISRASLVHHQRIHTGERPYECSVCPKRFSVYQRLQIHIRTHTGERPFQCPHCPKAFKHKAALNRHNRVHSGARPYRCATCGKAFSQSNSMKQHAASVHLKAPLYARKPKQDTANEAIDA